MTELVRTSRMTYRGECAVMRLFENDMAYLYVDGKGYRLVMDEDTGIYMGSQMCLMPCEHRTSVAYRLCTTKE